MGEGGVGSAEFDVGAGDGAVLGVVNDSVKLAEDGGVGRGGARRSDKKTKQSKLAHELPRQRADRLELQ